MVQEQVFLKGGGADTFPISFFQSLTFLHLEITLPLCYAFEEQYHENFTFFILGLLELFSRKFCKFLKK